MDCSSNNSSALQKGNIRTRSTWCRANQFSELLINTAYQCTKVHNYII